MDWSTLTHWLENIAKPSLRHKPYIGYRSAVNRSALGEKNAVCVIRPSRAGMTYISGSKGLRKITAGDSEAVPVDVK